MNKVIWTCAILVTVFFINVGLGLRAQLTEIKQELSELTRENASLSEEIARKRQFERKSPQTVSSAFTLFVNEIRMFETYSGSRMNIAVNGREENQSIEDHYINTEFRQVKGLPLTINVEKFSTNTDMVEVLNDIHLLESHTDFKVSEIFSENNTLTVKGELYGI
jgi:hypothetical protein